MSPARFAKFDEALGPEPLDPAFTPQHLSGILRDSRQAVKKVLMDQRRMAGVGNIYANEALWRAGIDPSRPSSTIEESEARALHAGLTGVLREAIAGARHQLPRLSRCIGRARRVFASASTRTGAAASPAPAAAPRSSTRTPSMAARPSSARGASDEPQVAPPRQDLRRSARDHARARARRVQGPAGRVPDALAPMARSCTSGSRRRSARGC